MPPPCQKQAAKQKKGFHYQTKRRFYQFHFFRFPAPVGAQLHGWFWFLFRRVPAQASLPLASARPQCSGSLNPEGSLFPARSGCPAASRWPVPCFSVSVGEVLLSSILVGVLAPGSRFFPAVSVSFPPSSRVTYFTYRCAMEPMQPQSSQPWQPLLLVVFAQFAEDYTGVWSGSAAGAVEAAQNAGARVNFLAGGSLSCPRARLAKRSALQRCSAAFFLAPQFAVRLKPPQSWLPG